MASLFDDIEEDGLFGDIPSGKGTNLWQHVNAIGEVIANSAVDVIGATAGMVAVPAAVFGNVVDAAQGAISGKKVTYRNPEDAYKNVSEMISGPLRKETSEVGQEYMKYVDEFNRQVMDPLIAMPNIGGPRAAEKRFNRTLAEKTGVADFNVPVPKSTKPGASTKTAEDIILERKQAEAQARTEDVVTDTRAGSQLSKEALQAALREKELQKQSAFWREPQHADMIKESPMDRMTRDLGGEPLRPVEQGLSALDQQLVERSTPEQWAAQDQIAARQAQIEQDVTRQTRLEMMAAERARQEGAPAVSAEHRAWAEAQESARLAAESEKAQRMQQMDIVEDYGNNDPMSRMSEMRVDENGIPIRSDLSMEAQQLQNPLQRNLWGDELAGNKGDVPLTRAIDKMPDGPARQEALSRLGWAKKQGGAIDVKAIMEAWENLKNKVGTTQDLLAAFKGTYNPDRWKYLLDDIKDPKSRSTVVLMPPEDFLKLSPSRLHKGVGREPMTTLSNKGLVDNHKSIQKGLKSEKGLHDIPFLLLDSDGKGGTVVTGHEGRHRMDVFHSMGIPVVPVHLRHSTLRWGETPKEKWPTELLPQFDAANTTFKDGKIVSADPSSEIPVRIGEPLSKRYPPRSQRGNVDLDLLTLGLSKLIKTGKEQPRPDTPATPRSLPMIQAREQERLTSKLANLSEFVPYTTVEEAVYHAKNAKDITKDLGQKSLAPGMNFAAIYTNNPVLKWANYVFRNARNTADRMSRKYITADDVGLSPLFSKMTDMERVQVMDTLQSGDRHQMKIDDAMMTELGMSDTQKQFIKSYYEANDALFNRRNEVLENLGFKPVKYRTGHFPGVFSGAYKSLVMGDKVNKDGSIAIDKNGNPIQEVKGVIATDTVAQREAAKAYFKSQNSGYTIIDKKRQGLVGNAVRSDLFSGMNDIMSMLAENDPRFAEVQAAIQEAVKQGNKNLFDFSKHELAKKGVVGNMGNKPWLDKNTNAKEGFKALVDYFEEGFLYNELQEPLRDAKSLATNPEVTHLPNTLAYLDKYVKNITGQGTNVIGQALNAVLDAPFALLGETKLGVGPKVPMEVANTVKNKMSQVFMGWGNYMFTLQQLMQPAQTALPTFQLIASRLGDHTGALRSMSKGGIDFMQMWSDNPKNVPEHMQTAYKYAMDHGLFNFSEMERAYEGVKSKAGRIADNIAEFNILFGERATRTPMFMGYVDLLVKNGIDVKDALPIAEHATQLSMVDYHAWERAQVYSGMGVLGQFAGALTTYKHGSTGMNFVLGKEIGRTGNPVPLGLSVAAMLLLAGITGLPFYDDIDSAFGAMTEKFGSKRQSIRQAFLENMPEWANSGVISAATGINLQSKFSAANMVPNPDEIGKSLSPQISGSVQIIGDAIDLAKNQDKEALRNLLGNLPSPWRGEAAYQLRDSQGRPVDRKGNPGVSYDFEEQKKGSNYNPEAAKKEIENNWMKRRLTGAKPTGEASALTKIWEANRQKKADDEKKIQISEEYARGIRNNTLTAQRQQELFDEYTARGGDINTLIKLHESVPKNQAMNPAQRAGGVAPGNTVPSINRFQYYNK